MTRLPKLTVPRAIAVIAVASVVLGGGLFVVSTAYAQFGGPKAAVNTREWALRPMTISATACATCHTKEAAAQATNLHAGIACETCHGPLDGHPGSDPNAVVQIAKPTAALCVQCHAEVPGRPAGFAQIDLDQHYGGGALCLRCHDPHDVVAAVPPKIPHPLVGLPACTVCHRPDGLKPVPSGHTMVADAVCLSCHTPLLSQP
jgi:nitrate/TMAO reductase-like tetraheme cytochrome c subunit